VFSRPLRARPRIARLSRPRGSNPPPLPSPQRAEIDGPNARVISFVGGCQERPLHQHAQGPTCCCRSRSPAAALRLPLGWQGPRESYAFPERTSPGVLTHDGRTRPTSSWAEVGVTLDSSSASPGRSRTRPWTVRAARRRYVPTSSTCSDDAGALRPAAGGAHLLTERLRARGREGPHPRPDPRRRMFRKKSAPSDLFGICNRNPSASRRPLLMQPGVSVMRRRSWIPAAAPCPRLCYEMGAVPLSALSH